MEFEPLSRDGLVLVRLRVVTDERGCLSERFVFSSFQKHGLPTNFVQDNHSLSVPRVLRGLHYQYPAQGKLVGVTRGRIWDVAVDIRPRSSTFGLSYGVELNNTCLLWIPPGFAHGFCVLGNEPADVVYKMTAEYDPSTQGGIVWSDADLNIDWPVADPIISARDRKLGTFGSYCSGLSGGAGIGEEQAEPEPNLKQQAGD